MAKSYNQKAKILYLQKMMQRTNENQTITMQQILEELLSYGITAERKSIYDDFESLRLFGMDVCYRRGKNGGYYLASTPMENSPAQQETAAGFTYQPGAQREDGKKMKLLFQPEVLDEVKAYFGEMAEYKEKSTGEWSLTTELVDGAHFFGWLTAMGRDVYIKKPRRLAQEYRDYLKTLLKEYKNI